MKQLLGGKGANLAEMCRIGLSVPPGFTITTDACAKFHAEGRQLPASVWEEVLSALANVEGMMGTKFGDTKDPLLVSVRSGAAVSMPGMMDTVLNLGMNDAVVAGLGRKAGERFAWDSYRRFLDMFGGVVMGISHSLFEHELEVVKSEAGVLQDTELTAEHLKAVVARFKQVYQSQSKRFPEEPLEQLRLAVYAVFDSWHSERANLYRRVNKITGLTGTAVNVQAMAYGNLGDTSGTGVCFTRDPSTGKKELYGEYLVNAQGEDVVAGIRTPLRIDVMQRDLPDAFEELLRNCAILEREYRDMQDIEFTVQEGKLYMLQCRSGKRTGAAAVKIAAALVDEGVVSIPAAIMMVEPGHLDQLLHPQFEDEEAYQDSVIGRGLPASPGAAVGQVVFDSNTAEDMAAAGVSVILVRRETSPEDVKGMYSAAGVLTQLGGMTSHAAVVARGWGKTCITGCSAMSISDAQRTATIGGVTLREGDLLSLNGSTGEIILGKAPVKPPELKGDVARFMSWVDEYRRLGVLTNADTPEDAAQARANGAEGIGLTRTEHMFFKSAERILAVRRMILAQTTEARVAALRPIEAFQREDFEGIFRAMDGLPVTVRLLDPPLHEFLPAHDNDEAVEELAAEAGMSVEALEDFMERMQEVNPMLGFRGCRLAIAYPEIAEAQVRAIMAAACACQAQGVTVKPDIMVPLVGSVQELRVQEQLVRRVAEAVMLDAGQRVAYRVGTMIEVPRAALLAGEIAEVAEFFSFGTNDLTQMTYGFSRDDIGKFLPMYLRDKILAADPFQVLDREGVGALIRMATEAGRATRPDLKVGICGEQGGEPSSVEFVDGVGLDYVSCSPFRVPIARLAAAQAVIKAEALA